MSERVTDGAVKPELTVLNSIIERHLLNHAGIVVVEGLEWLVTKHGEDNVLSFIRSLRESVHRTQWSIFIPVRPLAFSSIWLAHLRREAPSFTFEIEQTNHDPIYTEDESSVTSDDDIEPQLQIHEDGSPRLVMLTKLPEIGFSHSLLRKRILQWRRMGLDVAGVEPALTMEEAQAYVLYAEIEEKVRRAVDLDHALSQMNPPLSATDEVVTRFRIRQLTGLDELEVRYFAD